MVCNKYIYLSKLLSANIKRLIDNLTFFEMLVILFSFFFLLRFTGFLIDYYLVLYIPEFDFIHSMVIERWSKGNGNNFLPDFNIQNL